MGGGISRPVAWLSLDQGDNDLTRFLSYVVAGLQTVKAGIGQALLGLEPGPQAAALEGPLTLPLNELRQTSPLVLVFDYHVINTDGIHRALTFMIEHLPAGPHLVIATRADPSLPLARLCAPMAS
jgi:LuxR family maltose regulon positive regulatory protein